LSSDLVWSGEEGINELDYTLVLTSSEKSEIQQALKFFSGLGLDGSQVTKDTFPLPTLQHRLHSLSRDLHQGRGFFTIRGLDPDEFSPEDNILVFLGISSYIAEKRAKQDDHGNLFAHIRQAKLPSVPQEDRPVRDSNLPSAFHTDMFCNVLAMQIRGCAASGGNHIIASAWNVYNELARTRKDLLEVLATPNWTFDHRGRLMEPDKRPLLYYHGGKVILNFVRQPIMGLANVARSNGLPTVTPQQVEALDAIQSIAEKHQHHLSMQLGDLIFINNLSILHAREGFQDDEENTRYLVRMWLKNESLAWKLPLPLQRGNERLFNSLDIEEKWNIRYQPRLRFPLRERLSP
ncbi:Clavaminate synthase-like protein, partial [Hyaloscypha variabilis F]